MSLWRRLRERFLGGGAEGEPDAGEDRSTGAADRTAPAARDAARVAPGARASASAAPSQPPGADVVAAAEADELSRLRRAGAPDGPSVEEAIAILRRVRGTLRETDAVERVLAAMAERAVPDPVRVACADILAARGDEQGALRLLEGGAPGADGARGREACAPAAGRTGAQAPAEAIASTAGLILAADLYASIGQLPRALGSIERVLAREIDAPGALERHQRWRAALGAPRAAPGRLDEATMVAPAASGGPFRLLREIARGGAGTVYEAEDEVLGRRVGFKVYHGRGDARPHLEREARLASALAGPGVVRVFDADPAEGWIALEWIARGSIRDVLRAGDAASLAPIARWAWPLARAIARVHGHGYVHADVKPGNVLLRQVAEPVLGDFGIARPRGAPPEGGSPGYVSPERLAGRPCDPRDDIYGYGRVIEDVLVRLDALPAADAEPWRSLALRCIGPDEHRPADGAELLRALP